MSLVTLDSAKIHLRVEADATYEDDLIQALVNAAELSASAWLNRLVFVDQSALNAAIAATPAALTAATAAYVAASAAADLVTDEIEQDIAQAAADTTYANAQAAARATNYGMVVNDSIKSAVLLTVGHLYANREATTPRQLADLPMGVQFLLQPFRVYP